MPYIVFRRKPWRKVGGRYAPNPGARKTVIRKVETIEEARKLCLEGPGNIAFEEGREYRHLPFHEFIKA